jgi:putative Mg2+ transporter-C (MgtC) family protein
MQNISIEFLGEVPLYLGLGIEICTALLLGGLVGLEREQKMKAAGVKTNIMICIGATVYTAMGQLNILGIEGGAIDPNRVAAQIVSGVGFLGAGAIIQGRGNVVGMTTAATIWVVAAIGMAIGSGYPIVATICTITILLVLKILGPLYRIFELEKDHKNYHLEVLSRGRVKHNVTSIILSEINQINEISEEVLDKDNDERLLNVYITMHPRRVKTIMQELKRVIKVEKVRYYLTDYTGASDND